MTKCALSCHAASLPDALRAPVDWKPGQHLPDLSRTQDQEWPGPPPDILLAPVPPDHRPEKKTTIIKTPRKNPSKSYLQVRYLEILAGEREMPSRHQRIPGYLGSFLTRDLVSSNRLNTFLSLGHCSSFWSFSHFQPQRT